MANKAAENKESTDLQPVKSEQLANSERFTEMVLREFGSSIAGELRITEYQRSLIQGYFIGIDRALKMAEDNRIRKNAGNKDHEKYDNTLPFSWNTINLDDLALDVVHYARMGLDMMQSNHLFPIPYRNNKTNKYDITLMPGYNGIQYIAEKYAIEKPTAVTIELVYSTDVFKPIKKSVAASVEGYSFEITNPFDRGEVVGGFGYIEYEDPIKNKLIVMSKKDIEKRKPKYASAEFWGGKKTEWVDGKKTTVEIEGWYDEMCRKTIVREVYSAKHIPRDPKKVDDNYQYMKMREAHYAEIEARAEIDSEANMIILEPDDAIDDSIDMDPDTGEVIDVQHDAQPAPLAPAGQDAKASAGPEF